MNTKLKHFVGKYNIGQYFSEDMSPYFKLLFFPKGSSICQLDEPLDYFMFFVQGRAKVFMTLENGKRLLLCFYEPLQILGDKEIARGGNASASMVALEDCYCVGLSIEEHKSRLLQDPVFLRRICAALAEKMDRVSVNSSINLLSSLENRVASYIIGTSVRAGGDYIFKMNLTDMAELLGTSYRHLHRTLGNLCDEGLLMKTGSSYIVLAPEELKTRSAGLYL